jgi:hypothetical protein
MRDTAWSPCASAAAWGQLGYLSVFEATQPGMAVPLVAAGHVALHVFLSPIAYSEASK